jgi:glycine cleavage system H protein
LQIHLIIPLEDTMSHPADNKYTKSHEFIKPLDGNRARVGVTFHAQSELGDITFVELPEIGAEYKKGDAFSVVESVKAVSDIYMPVDGKIAEVNSALEDSPELINEDPYELGWLVEIVVVNPSQLDSLLSKEEYENEL